MNRKGDKSLIVGLDIGTSKVVALVGEYTPGEPIEVIGIGSHASHGLKRGVVVDIESTVHSIQRAIEEAELMAGCEIRSVYASISGSHTQCRNSPGIVPIRDGEVTYADMERVLEAAKAVAIPSDQRILHAIPQEYIVDNSQEGIRNPVGMSGVRLEVRAHLVVCALSAAQNIGKCVQPLPSAGRRPDPRLAGFQRRGADRGRAELGVALVDIGAGTTDIAVFAQGAIRHSASLPIAGDQVTNDIAHMLRTPTPHAERSRCATPARWRSSPPPRKSIQVPSVGDRPPRRPRVRRWRSGAEPLRGNLRDGAGRTAPLRLRGTGACRHGADRRCREDGRRGGTGRGNAAHAGAHRHSAARHRPGRSGGQSGACHRRRPAAVGQPDRAPAPAGLGAGPGRHVLVEGFEVVSRRVLTPRFGDPFCMRFGRFTTGQWFHGGSRHV
jgi:cell division protein FtsA